jgi:hypothetical protein
MNGMQLATSMHAFARFSGDKSLIPIAHAVSSGGALATTKIVAKVAKYWKATGRNSAFPAAQKSQLEAIRAVLESSAAPAAAKDYASLLSLFYGQPDGDSATFAQDLVTAINTPIPAKPRKLPKSPAPPIDTRQMADKLTILSDDNAAFDAEIAAIDANKKLKKADLQKVANQYLGYEREFKNRIDIIKAIKARQLQDAIQGSRERRGEKIAV